MEAGTSGNCAVNKWMTHPSFISFNKNGFWVGKFEATGTVSNNVITANTLGVLPGVEPIRNASFYETFTKAYNYNRILDSHMVKNTEWGAIAYLSHSKYGMGKKSIYINNGADSIYKTGCVGNGPDTAINTAANCQNDWYSSVGLNGSTTGNVTGLYDMSGGVFEYVAAYRNEELIESGFSLTSTDENYIGAYNTKYFDVYPSDSISTSWDNRILGDATGELGPFIHNTYNTGSWYGDLSVFVYSTTFCFRRGSYIGNKTYSGLFSFTASFGGNDSSTNGFRLALTP